jgi:hypothetical protein
LLAEKRAAYKLYSCVFFNCTADGLQPPAVAESDM